jgi:hypothetical protein
MGEIVRYWAKNTQEKGFIHITQLFIQRLIQRGHRIEDISLFYALQLPLSITFKVTETYYNKSFRLKI